MLMKVYERFLRPIPPFDFDSTVYVPHYFPTPDSMWQPSSMWQTLNLKGKTLGLKMENKGTTEKPQVKLKIYSLEELQLREIDKVINEVCWRYGFDEDISGFLMEFENDRFLKPAFKRLKGMRNNCANSLYELLIISIVLQNAAIRRSVQMMNNLFNAYGTKMMFDNKELSAYWSPVEIAKSREEKLKTLKVGYRAKMIKLVSEAFARGEVDES